MGIVESKNKLNIDIGNKINQIANAECVNTIVSSREIKSSIINSVIEGDVSIGNVSIINGVSCSLRSTLSNDLVNSIVAQQSAEASDEDNRNAFERLADSARSLTPWGAASQMFESGRQVRTSNETVVRMANEITQQINTICQNRLTNVDAPLISDVVDTTIKGNLTIGDKQEISQTSCVIENGIKNTVRNNNEFSQDAKSARSKGNSLLAVIIAIVIIIGLFVLLSMMGGAGHLTGGGDARDE